MTTPPAPQSDPIVVALKHTEAELAEKLEEACVPDTREVSKESTAELAKLSDSLLAAARAAKDVVSRCSEGCHFEPYPCCENRCALTACSAQLPSRIGAFQVSEPSAGLSE